MIDSEAVFNLSEVFATAASLVPDRRALIWRDRDYTYAQMDARIGGVANFLVSQGLGAHTERERLADHESGQDHLGLYMRNCNEYLEAMIGSYRARVAPFNVSFRYVENELIYLLDNADAKVLVYQAEFAPIVAAVRDKLPQLRLLIQVHDDSGHELLPGAVDFDAIVNTPAPPGGLPSVSPEDLYLVYTGGTTGMPKAVLWRQHDIFVSSMGGRPFGADRPFASYKELGDQMVATGGFLTVLLVPPLIHGSGQWAAFHAFTQGGWVAMPNEVDRLNAADVLRLAERERVAVMPLVGDAMAKPIIEEMERASYDLSGLININNGGAPMSRGVRERITNALPNCLLIDAVGASETGVQLNHIAGAQSHASNPTFTASHGTAVVSADLSRLLTSGDEEGWLARSEHIPLGYLKDAEKTARTFLTIDDRKWSIPGDRARLCADGTIELLGRDSMTINSGGEKIFAEEVENAVRGHPDVYDVIVVGRPSERWGSEVVAVVQLVEGSDVSDQDLAEACTTTIARYKVPKAFVRRPKIMRSPAGKADYRWAITEAGAAQ